jgi:cobalt-zinc-cadmium efflux system outer membrane protein
MRRSVIRWFGVCGLGLLGGCAGPRVTLPPGHGPRVSPTLDVQTSAGLSAVAPPATAEPTPTPPAGGAKPAFDIPPGLPGAAAPPPAPPRFDRDTPPAERLQRVRQAYPELLPVAVSIPAEDGPPLSLADLQRIAKENHPAIRKAMADADAAYGQVIQAGLYPNPTVGYQVDQWTPGLRPPPGSPAGPTGQQGGFISQLIKTAGKLTLAQQVAGYDYINALVAVRRAEVEVIAAVRTHYFAALVARQSIEANRRLADMLDELYRIQLRQLAAGEAAGHEPLQLYAQAVQARNAVALAEANYRAAWKQLAAAVGQPDRPPAPLAGRADAPAPVFEPDLVRARLLDEHTDLLAARNSIAQAQTNLALQRRLPIPDVQTNTYHQYDNLAQLYQFGVQLGITLPVADRNQGNIRTAQAKISVAAQELDARRNELSGRLGEAFGRYQAHTAIAANYRDRVLPNLAVAYRAIVQRYQLEPDKVQFNDIVVAQQNYGQALQAYLANLDAQWKAVVDVANLGQLDELYPAVEPQRLPEVEVK